jgi:hypothetical protein
MIDAIGIECGCAGGFRLIKDLFHPQPLPALGTLQSIKAPARCPRRAVPMGASTDTFPFETSALPGNTSV